MGDNIKKILLITGVRIGDQLMATPFFRALRKRYPNSEIVLAGGYPALGILGNNPNLDELMVIDKNIIPRILQRGKFDLAIDLCGAADTAYLTVVSGAKRRIGNRHVGLPRTKPELYTRAVGRSRKQLSFLDRYLFMAKEIGLKGPSKKTEIFLTQKERKNAEEVFKRLNLRHKDFVVGVFASGSRGEIRWSAKRYAGLADRITSEFGVKILFLYEEREKGDLKKATSVMKNPYYLSGEHDIKTIAAMLELCSCVIAGNRGPMHIAAALNTPVVGIFGPYSEYEFFPYPKQKGIAISKDLSCRPCGMGYKRCKNNIKCLRSLSVEEVFERVKPFIKKLKN